MRWHPLAPVRPPPGFIQPCLPFSASRPPHGPGWLYEIKHDGYRLMVKRTGDTVRIFTRRGVDWTNRFPRIADAVRQLKISSIMLDGEGVVCDDRGLAVFDRLHSKAHDGEVTLFAFDLLELDGEDYRSMPLLKRKLRLRTILKRMQNGIYYTDHLDSDGAMMFEHACRFGCEGIVAKRVDQPYRSGRSKGWLKIKNPNSPAALRIEEGTF